MTGAPRPAPPAQQLFSSYTGPRKDPAVCPSRSSRATAVAHVSRTASAMYWPQHGPGPGSCGTLPRPRGCAEARAARPRSGGKASGMTGYSYGAREAMQTCGPEKLCGHGPPAQPARLSQSPGAHRHRSDRRRSRRCFSMFELLRIFTELERRGSLRRPAPCRAGPCASRPAELCTARLSSSVKIRNSRATARPPPRCRLDGLAALEPRARLLAHPQLRHCVVRAFPSPDASLVAAAPGSPPA